MNVSGCPLRCTYCDDEPVQAIEARPSGKMIFLCRGCVVIALGSPNISQATRAMLEATLERTREGKPS